MRERYSFKKKASLAQSDLKVVGKSTPSASAANDKNSTYHDFRFDIFEE